MFIYPNFNPVALSIGEFDIYWYGVTYLVGFVLAYMYLSYRKKISNDLAIKSIDLDNVFTYAFVGVLLGGRFFYILFYFPSKVLSNPFSLFEFYAPGRSFHAGFLGVVLGLFIYARIAKTKFLLLTDFIVPAVPIGIACGRIGNFINAELIGRVTTKLPWAIVYTRLDHMPRHPSQLYEFLLEGVVTFIILHFYTKNKTYNTGAVSGLFCVLYAVARIICEFFREPDLSHGFVWFNTFTMGQILTLPILLVGMILLFKRVQK